MNIEKYDESDVGSNDHISLVLHDSDYNLYEVKYYLPFNCHGPFEAIVNNEIYTYESPSTESNVIKKEPLPMNIIGLSGIRIKDKMYPAITNMKIALEAKEEMEKEIIRVLWRILCGETGRTIDDVILFMNTRNVFHNSNDDNKDEDADEGKQHVVYGAGYVFNNPNHEDDDDEESRKYDRYGTVYTKKDFKDEQSNDEQLTDKGITKSELNNLISLVQDVVNRYKNEKDMERYQYLSYDQFNNLMNEKVPDIYKYFGITELYILYRNVIHRPGGFKLS